MNTHSLKSLYIPFIVALLLLTAAIPSTGYAQAVPDTSLNKVFPDTTQITKSIEGKKADDSMQAASQAAAAKTDTGARKRGFVLTPKRTGMYSALLPGLGQYYNKQYWKIPVIYAGIGVSAYYFVYNLNNYNSYRKAYIDYPNDTYGIKYNQSQLQQIRDDFERYLDLTALLAGVGYVVQILDAIASAHLKDFDISRDLSLKMRPVAAPNGIGFGLVLNVKNRTRYMPDTYRASFQ